MEAVSPAAGVNFYFVSAQDCNASDSKLRARSHAVKQALRRKRKLEHESQSNFRVISSQDIANDLASKRQQTPGSSRLARVPSPSMLDPFKVLAVDSQRFQRLLHDGRTRQASEPVFSVTADSSFHSFPAVFRGGLNDPALGNAVMFMLTFAIAKDTINQEGLGYQELALSHLRERIGSIDRATSLATFGTILFLAGVEARLGMRAHAQMHLHAIQQLLEISRKRGMSLTAGIKRAIFWQDLNASIMAGSLRIVDHNTFVELYWQRDPFAPHYYHLPPGFKPQINELGSDFIAILEDVHALQLIRDQARPHAIVDPLEIAYINNHQASIQSRLVHLAGLSPILDCIRLTAYLCSSMLCCRVWCGHVIPRQISTHLFHHLQLALDDPVWDDSLDLLRWITCIGASFAYAANVRAEFVSLVRERMPQRFGSAYYDRFLRPLPGLSAALGQFVWSDSAFSAHVDEFWGEVIA